MSDAKRTALVTGSSSGIGLASAVALAQAGLQVVATMRDTTRELPLKDAAEAAGVALDIRSLDVTDEEGAAQCVADVVEAHGAIDVLVNNAGAGFVSTLEQLSNDDLRQVMEVNFIGAATLTRLVLPEQRARGIGRIITVTSVGGIVGQPFNDAYCAAKFATEGLMESLAPVAARFGITVSVIEPGAVATEFVANVGETVAERMGATDDPHRPLLEAYIGHAQAAFAAAQTPEEVAAVIVQAATEDKPRFRYQTSDSAGAFVGVKLADLDGSGVQGMTSGWLG